MPCRYDYGSSSDCSQTERRLDKVTELLCSLCTKLEKQESFNNILKTNKSLAIWWEEHQEKDRKEARRKAKELERNKLKTKALSKLTIEERKILGL